MENYHLSERLPMIYDSPRRIEIPTTNVSVVALSDHHIPGMLALTQLTNPGPFSQRTIEFGHYEGIFEKSNLVALAGQRLNPQPYAEISAVCTHPNYVGKGYARLLLSRQVNRMLSDNTIPFLHVREDNMRAIKLYEQIGFTTRTAVLFYVLQRLAIS